MVFIEGNDRKQLSLFKTTLDNEIPNDHIVRFIDAYVDKLDLQELGIDLNYKKKGKGYFPGLYLKIYIYSYFNKFRSSRIIEKECHRNIELKWLTKELSPDHWSISNFRKVNNKALISIYKNFLIFCYKINLISFDLIAIDGTKIRGQNHNSNIYKRDSIDQKMNLINQKIQNYLKELDSNDKNENIGSELFNIENIQRKINKLKKSKVKLEKIKSIFAKNLELQKYFANDPDCNFQKDNGRTVCGYNCQIAVDSKNKLIIATDITSENNDRHQLNLMKNKVKKIKKELNNIENKKINKTVICADAGYHCEKEIIEALKDNEINLFVPHPNDSKMGKNKVKIKKKNIEKNKYSKDKFRYDKSTNTFFCPNNKQLFSGKKYTDAYDIKRIAYRCHDCQNCNAFGICTTSKKGRTISISSNYDIIEKFREKVQAHSGKIIISKRKEIVEHPFGTLKKSFGYRYFMRKGISNVKAELNLIAFTYNLKRVINIIGVPKLLRILN